MGLSAVGTVAPPTHCLQVASSHPGTTLRRFTEAHKAPRVSGKMASAAATPPTNRPRTSLRQGCNWLIIHPHLKAVTGANRALKSATCICSELPCSPPSSQPIPHHFSASQRPSLSDLRLRGYYQPNFLYPQHSLQASPFSSFSNCNLVVLLPP